VTKGPRLSVLFLLFSSLFPSAVTAQIFEAVGSRALGMGGAFVAVADDSSATWWNPAGLAAGPFLDIALARAGTRLGDDLRSGRDQARWLTLTTPPFGLSYYRLRITDIQPYDPTAGGAADREDGGAGVPVRSLATSQLGATFVQTLFPGVHAGTTVKYVRGTLRRSQEGPSRDAGDLLARGEDLEGGDGHGHFDLDAGVLAVGGPFRLGATVRNVRGPEIDGARLPRQVRVGAAFDGARVGLAPVTVALDADLRRYETGTGDRRVLAVGAEHWFAERRLGVRAGARVNTVGAEERTATVGVSVALRAALYVDAHVAGGGDADDRGWGVAVRSSF
jgi:hypothetical protein